MRMGSLKVAALMILVLFAHEGRAMEGGGPNAHGPAVTLEFTFPAGQSPSVFREGWVFGARFVVDPGGAGERDLSDRASWSGTGLFNPPVGALSRPFFKKAGKNTVTITAEVDGRTYRQDLTVNAVSSLKYAAVGDTAQCDRYALGCPKCPHVATGPITTGSENVLLGGKPAARKGDKGVAIGGCSSAEFEILEGDPNVLIDGRPAARLGDETKHFGGFGKIIAVSSYDPKVLDTEEILQWILFESDMPPGFSFALRSRSNRNVIFGGRSPDGEIYQVTARIERDEGGRKAAERYSQYARIAADRALAKDLGIGERSLIVGSKRRREHTFYTSQEMRIYWKEWTLHLVIYGYHDAGMFTDQQAGEYLKQLGTRVFDRFVKASALHD